ncbi:protein disulfide isomerase Creld2-like isoform X2 [Antedon mediterranea]|uniref:protein disulfide isomerase Creld2-like isoform X2 n=1 Tax=Antedon mediterranea TaxID=105859 RepID=UPI003AF54BB1
MNLSVSSMNVSWTSLTILIFVSLLHQSSFAGKRKDTIKKCQTCRNIVNGFQEGITRTSRYNFGGGDVDWEEKKLGTYQTSETRFIEITDNICESSKHECHTLLEENEEILEEWWKEHQQDFPDLLQWFCIDLLKYCCINGTFGPECQECPGGIERPCQDKGECKGSGTRAGSGKCDCKAGYTGLVCDECKDGHYEEFKNETDTLCTECHKSCRLKCKGPEPKECEECKDGWLWNDELGCQDVNECEAEEPPCKATEYCENNEGSYDCESCHSSCDQCLGKGNDKCVKCGDGYIMNEGICEDINECEGDDHGCTGEHKMCKNVPGRYRCDCEDGFELMGGECIDKKLISQLSQKRTELSTTGEILTYVLYFFILIGSIIASRNSPLLAMVFGLGLGFWYLSKIFDKPLKLDG